MSNLTWEERKGVLLEGLDGVRKNTTEIVLENSRKVMHEERALFETAAGDATSSTHFARYDKLLMPLVRRVMPALFAMELVGVQPMSLPVGMVRTLRFRYANDVETTEGSGVMAVTAGEEASGMNVYEKYSLIAAGEAYDASDARSELDILEALESQAGNKLTMDVVKDTITAKTRKLSATWSIEADQDAKALDGLDIENEMVVALADQIQREMDRELLNKLEALAGSVKSFDFATADGRYAGEKFTALTIGFSDLSNQIAVKTKLGGATWMVVSPNVFTALRNANNNAFVPAVQGDYKAQNSLFVGTLNGNIKVYVDNYATTDTVLMGHKGESEMAAGLIYAPYVPISNSGIVRDPETMDLVMSLMTRYAYGEFTNTATTLGNSADYYARGSVANLKLGF